MIEKIDSLKKRAFSTKFVPILLIIVGLSGFLFGIYFYWQQLMRTPFYLWIFAIDCPLYVILFCAIIAMRMKGKSNLLFNFFVSIGLIKYGLWTIASVAASGWEWFWFLVPLHSVMVIAGASLVLYSKTGMHGFIGAFAWFLTNDFIDVFLKTIPYVNITAIEIMIVFSFVSTVIIVPLVFVVTKIIKQNKQF